MTNRVVEVDGRTLTFTNVDRPLWPGGFTKGDMLEYYAAVADVIVPHLRGRALTLRRFPEGVEGTNWYQTNCRGQPSWMRTAEVSGRHGAVFRMCIVDDAASLLWVANLGAIELHPFLTTADAPHTPTALVFDLDPEPPADLLACCDLALRLRELLAEAGVEAFVKTSGSLGLHVYVPLATRYSDDETKACARAVAERLAAERPAHVAAEATLRSARPGKVLVDWRQNDAVRSTVAPYSLRAMPWPLVSAPVGWEEVEAAAVRRCPDALVIEAHMALERVARLGDPFAPVLALRQELPC
ncbi:MAG: ATP-dependent DNA ligase [Thermoleophilia bacterium]|nr:ATP-dependent DNA ligase [Thermoleophilia bacterium]